MPFLREEALTLQTHGCQVRKGPGECPDLNPNSCLNLRRFPAGTRPARVSAILANIPTACLLLRRACPFSPSPGWLFRWWKQTLFPRASLTLIQLSFLTLLSTSDLWSINWKTLDFQCKQFLNVTRVETLFFSWNSLVEDVNNQADSLEQRAALRKTASIPVRSCTHFLFTIFIYVIYIEVYIVYTCNILYFSWIHFYHFKKCVLHILGLFFFSCYSIMHFVYPHGI